MQRFAALLIGIALALSYGLGAQVGGRVSEVNAAEVYAGNLTVTGTCTGCSPTFPILGSSGSATAPTYSFSGDTNTGVYRQAADQLGITTGGTVVATVSTTNFSISGASAVTLEGSTNNLNATTTTIDASGGNDELIVTANLLRSESNSIVLDPGLFGDELTVIADSIAIGDGSDTITLNAQAISFGAADSCGAGFRCVRVPN